MLRIGLAQVVNRAWNADFRDTGCDFRVRLISWSSVSFGTYLEGDIFTIMKASSGSGCCLRPVPGCDVRAIMLMRPLKSIVVLEI